VYSPTASSNNLYNVDEFIISGVSLGDNVEQVINGLTTFYSINADDLEISTEYGGPAIEYFEFVAEGLEVIAYFEPKEEPEDSAKGDNPNVLVLFTINYDQPSDDYKTYANKIAKQYGAPSKTLEASRGTSYGWCEKVGSKGIFATKHIQCSQ